MAFETALGAERLCTIREIADKSGLGAGTVHRALKGGKSVHRDTCRLVIDTMRQLNEEKIMRAARLAEA
jgi:DNA-binding LacI/PurR family transcriptional regulator